jgi:tetratricopeptide (TPR) repeat protein
MPYVGQQQNWTTKPGAYVKVIDKATLYPPGQFPDRPYMIIGSVATDSEGNVAKAVHDQHADAALIYSNRKSPNGAIAIGNPNFAWAIPLTKSEVKAGLIKYSKAIQLEPDAQAYNDRGLSNKAKRDLDGAIANFTKAIEIKPDYATAYYNRGTTKQTKGDVDGALADFTKAIEIKPDFAAAYNNRGFTQKAKGDVDGAIADFTKAIQLKPDYAVAYYNRGNAQKAKGAGDGAIADFSKAIEIKPDFAEAYYNRGNVEQTKGDLGSAVLDLNKAIEIKPDLAVAYDNRGYLRYDSRDFKGALVDFRKEIELDSANDYAHFRVWLIRARLGEEKAATTELQTYLTDRANAKLDDWTSEIGHFLAGQLPEPQLLAAAKNADHMKEAGQLCEAFFYAASKRLFAGENAMATDYFEKAIATDKTDYLEYASAVAELKSLKTQK